MRLDDDKAYNFSTLTLRQQKAIRIKFKALEKDKEIDKLLLKSNETELTEEEDKKIEKYEEDQFCQLLEMARLSLAKRHVEFKVTEKITLEKINDDLQNLLDMPSLQKASSFAMSGTLPKDLEETYDTVDVIDLTTEESNGK